MIPTHKHVSLAICSLLNGVSAISCVFFLSIFIFLCHFLATCYIFVHNTLHHMCNIPWYLHYAHAPYTRADTHHQQTSSPTKKTKRITPQFCQNDTKSYYQNDNVYCQMITSTLAMFHSRHVTNTWSVRKRCVTVASVTSTAPPPCLNASNPGQAIMAPLSMQYRSSVAYK